MKTTQPTTRQKLTEKQQSIYDFIERQITVLRVSPTVREIGDQFGIRSSNGVLCHLRALERKGWIKRDHYLSRGITLIPVITKHEVETCNGSCFKIGDTIVRCVGPEGQFVNLEIETSEQVSEVFEE
ncbi:LexA repressor [Gimesia alba]|uniref:LexA repressor n=1 Tax=Gimesia alba TaxID=2527973 RepID=A0A517RB69_9PLAN|nr:hypothetical protein [Gimesia alba]QDT41084.1 LexA repressor [Gimesia alba]